MLKKLPMTGIHPGPGIWLQNFRRRRFLAIQMIWKTTRAPRAHSRVATNPMEGTVRKDDSKRQAQTCGFSFSKGNLQAAQEFRRGTQNKSKKKKKVGKIKQCIASPLALYLRDLPVTRCVEVTPGGAPAGGTKDARIQSVRIPISNPISWAGSDTDTR